MRKKNFALVTLHILAERINWFNKYVKNAPPRTKQQTAAN